MTVENVDTNGSQVAEAETENHSTALSIQARNTLLPQNRPIEPSHLEVVSTYSSVGSNRPITKGTVNFNSSLAISGNRPIAVSTLKVSDTHVLGNRPIASNEIDDPTTLMGYLD
jgi:hypothetical protein